MGDTPKKAEWISSRLCRALTRLTHENGSCLRCEAEEGEECRDKPDADFLRDRAEGDKMWEAQFEKDREND